MKTTITTNKRKRFNRTLLALFFDKYKNVSRETIDIGVVNKRGTSCVPDEILEKSLFHSRETNINLKIKITLFNTKFHVEQRDHYSVYKNGISF